MATSAVKGKNQYAIYGNVAYDPAYEPRHEGRAEPLVRPRERVAARTRVRVRPAGYVAPAAVLGFALVAVMAVLLLVNYAQLTRISNEIVHLRREAAALNEENAHLTAQYELAYDLKTVEEQVTASGSMIQPQPGQIVTLNIVEPDSARIYQDSGSGLARAWEAVAETANNLTAFFKR